MIQRKDTTNYSVSYMQAAKRQSAYEQSAVGKAAIKSVRAVKEERQQGGRPGTDTHSDWLN